MDGWIGGLEGVVVLDEIMNGRYETSADVGRRTCTCDVSRLGEMVLHVRK